MKPVITVTDHALLRYLERVKGVDLDSIRDEIAALVTEPWKAGRREVSVGGFTYMLGDHAVKTVVPGKSPNAARIKTKQHNGHSVRMRVR